MTTTVIDHGPAINTQEHLKALTFQRLHPRTYLQRFLQEDVRPDGRAFAGWRDISMNVGELFQIFCCTILLF
jgi:exosome complex component RRP43